MRYQKKKEVRKLDTVRHNNYMYFEREKQHIFVEAAL